MGNTLVELGKDIRKRNAAGLMKRLAPEIAEIRADFERQLAEKDAEIAELRKKNDELTNCLMVEQQENADHIAEIAALKAKVDARTDPGAEAPAKTTRRKNAK